MCTFGVGMTKITSMTDYFICVSTGECIIASFRSMECGKKTVSWSI